MSVAQVSLAASIGSASVYSSWLAYVVLSRRSPGEWMPTIYHSEHVSGGDLKQIFPFNVRDSTGERRPIDLSGDKLAPHAGVLPFSGSRGSVDSDATVYEDIDASSFMNIITRVR